MLEALKCVTCDSNNLEIQGSILVCKHCGTKYVYNGNASLTDRVPSPALDKDDKYVKKFMASLEMCEHRQDLVMDKNYLEMLLGHANYELDKTKADLAMSEKNLLNFKNNIRSMKGVTRFLSVVVWMFLIYGMFVWVEHNFERNHIEGVGIIFILWLVWFAWMIGKISEKKKLCLRTQNAINALDERIQQQHEAVDEAEAKVVGKQGEIDKYINEEMLPKCIIPKKYWSYANEMRDNIQHGCDTLESAVKKLKRQHTYLR